MFHKGQSGNPGGKKKGTQNRVTVVKKRLTEENQNSLRSIILAYITGVNEDGTKAEHSFIEDMNDPSMTGRDRLSVLERWSDYVFPKMQRTQVDSNVNAHVNTDYGAFLQRQCQDPQSTDN